MKCIEKGVRARIITAVIQRRRMIAMPDPMKSSGTAKQLNKDRKLVIHTSARHVQGYEIALAILLGSIGARELR